MQVSIYRDPCFGAVQITFWESRNGKNYVVKPMKMEIIEVADGDVIESPTLRISDRIAPQFLSALAEALDK